MIKLRILKKNLIKKLRLPIYGHKALRLSFEFGVVLSEVAKKINISITPGIMMESEKIIIKELKENGLEKTAVNFTPLIMTMLEEDRVGMVGYKEKYHVKTVKTVK